MKPPSVNRSEYILDEAETVTPHPRGNWDDVDPASIPTPGPFLVQNLSQESLFEAMTTNEDGRTKRWKTWEHYKRVTLHSNRSTFINGSNQWWTSPNSYQRRFATYHHKTPFYCWSGGAGGPSTGVYQPWYTLPKLYDPSILDGAFVAPPADLSGLVQVGLNTLLPRVKEELSLLNALFELKDMKTLSSSIASIWTVLFKGRTIKTAIGAASGSYLQYAFNIKPLLSDIAGFFSALRRVERQINDLITRSGRVQTRHFGAVLHEFNDGSKINAPYNKNQGSGGTLYNAVSCKTEIHWTHVPTVFHIEIQYNYNYTAYQLEHARVLALLDAFGVNLNPAIIWNAIPWSFVVDWVAGVSRWLNQFRMQNMEPMINIHQALWSVSRRRSIRSLMRMGQGYYDKPPLTPMPTVEELAYRRQVFRPTASSIETSGLTSREFSLGAALVFARKWRPGKQLRLTRSF